MYQDGLFAREAHIIVKIQIEFPTPLLQRILMMSNNSPLAGHSGQRRLYETLKQTIYWYHMAAIADYILRNCASCAGNNLKYVHKRHMHLFRAGGLFEIAAMEFVRPFPKAVRDNQYIFVFTERYFKLTRVVPTAKMTVRQVVKEFPVQRLILYGIQTYVLTDNWIKFASKLLATLCALPGVKCLASTP